MLRVQKKMKTIYVAHALSVQNKGDLRPTSVFEAMFTIRSLKNCIISKQTNSALARRFVLDDCNFRLAYYSTKI